MICRPFNQNDIPDILSLYENSFPPEEKRLFKDSYDFIDFLNSKNGIFNVMVCEDNGLFLGFLNYWIFKNFVYVEHFAVKPGLRGKGIGSFMLGEFAKSVSTDIILEVEHPCSAKAESRIKFYERNGFIVNRSFDYIQPPYACGLPPVPMLLMTHGNVIIENTTDISELLDNVYGATTS